MSLCWHMCKHGVFSLKTVVQLYFSDGCVTGCHVVKIARSRRSPTLGHHLCHSRSNIVRMTIFLAILNIKTLCDNDEHFY